VIEWSVEPDQQVPITGYVLEWDNGEAEGTFYELWNGRGSPEVLSYTTTVTTGTKYSFRHKAFNFNGESVYSDIIETYACISPAAPGAPTWVTSTTTTIELSWTGSIDDGGCPITGYALFRDDGTSGTPTDEIHTAELSTNTLATGIEVTEFPAGGLGFEFTFAVKVKTDFTELELGASVSSDNSAAFVLAGVPDAPAAAPVRGTYSGSTQVYVEFDAVAGTNGSPITSYFVEIDDGNGGDFTELQGYSLSSLDRTATKSTGVTTGLYYRVRYSARNIIGYGPVSPIAYILAADVPDTPFVSSTEDSTMLTADIVETNLVIVFTLPPNGGSPILQGQVVIYDAAGVANDVVSSTLDGFSSDTHGCTLVEDSTAFDSRTCSIPMENLRIADPSTNDFDLAQGDPIVMRIRFENEIGWSGYSEYYRKDANDM
jgi:hypothetical protein